MPGSPGESEYGLVGIVDYATYVPVYRLRREIIAEQWCARSAGGRKAVSNFDEDSLTLAYETAWSLVGRNAPVGALYFASTTSPYWQRACSSLIAAACDLPDELDTMDFGGTVRAGTAALRAAFNSVAAGTNRKVIVTAADVRDGAPESPEEQTFGDAAAAVVVGQEGVIAEVIAQTSRSDDFFDEWRRDRDACVTAIASRYAVERGYEANVVAAAQQILRMANLKPADVKYLALSSPDGRAHIKAARKLGFDTGQLVDVPLEDVGITGTAMSLALLCAALDRAEAGALILVVGYGDGADAVLLRMTGQRPKRAEHPGNGNASIEIPSYAMYRKLRDFNRRGPEDGAVISNVMFEQEERQNIRLHAGRCSSCGTVQFPFAPVCAKCHVRNVLKEVPMARCGAIFTFTKDYLYAGPTQPTVMAVIELGDGARFYCQMTDVEPQKVRIGMPVNLTLRRLKDGGGMHHYYWKCRPAQEPA